MSHQGTSCCGISIAPPRTPMIAYWSLRIPRIPSASIRRLSSGLSAYTLSPATTGGCIVGSWVSSCPSALSVTCRVTGSPASISFGSLDHSSLSVTSRAGNQAASGCSAGGAGTGRTLTVCPSDSNTLRPVIRPSRNTRASKRAGDMVISPLSCG